MAGSAPLALAASRNLADRKLPVGCWSRCNADTSRNASTPRGQIANALVPLRPCGLCAHAADVRPSVSRGTADASSAGMRNLALAFVYSAGLACMGSPPPDETTGSTTQDMQREETIEVYSCGPGEWQISDTTCIEDPTSRPPPRGGNYGEGWGQVEPHGGGGGGGGLPPPQCNEEPNNNPQLQRCLQAADGSYDEWIRYCNSVPANVRAGCFQAGREKNKEFRRNWCRYQWGTILTTCQP